jgi:hypothetical protein
MVATRLILDRVVLIRRGRPVRLKLPDIVDAASVMVCAGGPIGRTGPYPSGYFDGATEASMIARPNRKETVLALTER